jgi:hypothetical protein
MSIMMTDRLMLLGKMTEFIVKVIRNPQQNVWQNADFHNVVVAGTCSNHWALNG